MGGLVDEGGMGSARGLWITRDRSSPSTIRGLTPSRHPLHGIHDPRADPFTAAGLTPSRQQGEIYPVTGIRVGDRQGIESGDASRIRLYLCLRAIGKRAV